MNLNALEEFKNRVIIEMEKLSFDDWSTPRAEVGQEILWSKGPSYSIVPFELQMSDINPARAELSEPKNKKNAQKIYLSDGNVIRIDYFNARGCHHETEKIFYRENCTLSLKMNNHGEKIWLKVSEFKDKKVVMAGRVDFDSEFWLYRYEWNGDVVSEIISFCSNSVPGIVIYPEYDEHKNVTSMYFRNGDARINVFVGS